LHAPLAPLPPCLPLCEQKKLKSEHLLFQLFHLHIEREAVMKKARKKQEEQETAMSKVSGWQEKRSG
jgi:hypothetical protein